MCDVPALRFPGFKNSWDCTILEKLSKKIGDGIHSTPSYDDDGTFYFINGNNLNRGKIVITSSTKRVSEKEAYKNNAENLEADSILMSINGTIGNVALYNNEPIMLGKSACYINSKDNVDKKFLFYYLQYPKTQSYFEAELTGTTIKNLSLQSIRKTKICIPTIEEQHKISHFLQKIDERIATQNKIIEKLETLIKGIRNYVLNNKLQNTTKKKLGELCTITTGKLDANAMKSEGLYPFFTCAEEVYRIDSFAFDTEALLVSGNGANLGYIHYYKGKFNAYQRTYVLSNFIEDIHYIQIYLEAYLHKRIALEKSTSNTPYIVLATLAEMPIIIPNIKIQKDISNKILILKSKLITEIHIRNCYKDMRQFLLSQMFI